MVELGLKLGLVRELDRRDFCTELDVRQILYSS